MNIWVDADACPVAIKEILYKAAQRARVVLTLVANQALRTPGSRYIKTLQVMPGYDVADDEILSRVNAGDLVITSDIPLAAELIEKGAQVLSPRGELYTGDNIKARLNMRDFMDTLRGSGMHGGGPAPLSQGDRQTFANHLDRWLTRRMNDQ